LHPDDSEIVARFQTEDGQSYAFNLLIRKYGQKLYWVARRLVIDHDDANDIMQEVWIKVWQNLSGFKSASQLYTWLYRIAANESLTFLNRKKRRFFLPIGDVEGELSNMIDNSSNISGDEIEKKLQKAILALPEKQRLVFHMRYYDEMPYEEMSKVLDTSVGALKASYHHAAKKVEEFVTRAD
jgi:RNA polymerase sigma factor (sigma-70 family)